jgi:hypothetical protein
VPGIANPGADKVGDGRPLEDVLRESREGTPAVLLFETKDARARVLVLEKKFILELIGILVLVETDKAGDLGGREFRDNHFGMRAFVLGRPVPF